MGNTLFFKLRKRRQTGACKAATTKEHKSPGQKWTSDKVATVGKLSSGIFVLVQSQAI